MFERGQPATSALPLIDFPSSVSARRRAWTPSDRRGAGCPARTQVSTAVRRSSGRTVPVAQKTAVASGSRSHRGIPRRTPCECEQLPQGPFGREQQRLGRDRRRPVRILIEHPLRTLRAGPSIQLEHPVADVCPAVIPEPSLHAFVRGRTRRVRARLAGSRACDGIFNAFKRRFEGKTGVAAEKGARHQSATQGTRSDGKRAQVSVRVPVPARRSSVDGLPSRAGSALAPLLPASGRPFPRERTSPYS